MMQRKSKIFVSAAQTVFVVTCEIKAFSTVPSMGCDVFGLASLKSNRSLGALLSFLLNFSKLFRVEVKIICPPAKQDVAGDVMSSLTRRGSEILHFGSVSS